MIIQASVSFAIPHGSNTGSRHRLGQGCLKDGQYFILQVSRHHETNTVQRWGRVLCILTFIRKERKNKKKEEKEEDNKK